MRLPTLIRLVLLIVTGTVSVAGQVQAQRLNIDAFLQQWDTDHDGTLSVEEIKKAAIARFEELDSQTQGKFEQESARRGSYGARHCLGRSTANERGPEHPIPEGRADAEIARLPCVMM